MTKNRILEFKKVETNTKSVVKNNNADIVGILVSEPKLNHKNLNVEYYVAHLESPFMSKEGVKKSNIVPVLLSENDLKGEQLVVGKPYLARGRWSSVRHEDNTFSEFLFAKKVVSLDEDTVQYRNHVEIDGYVRRRAAVKECYNSYKQINEKQVETLVTILRPAGQTADGKDRFKTDTVTLVFRGNFVKAALGLDRNDRISIKGYIEECKDEEGNLIKYVVVATDATLVIEVEDKRNRATTEEVAPQE